MVFALLLACSSALDPARVVEAGYQITVADLGSPIDPQTVEQAILAFALDAQGQRERSLEALIALNQKLPRSALPAMFLGVAGAPRQGTTDWFELARSRLDAKPDAYQLALLRHFRWVTEEPTADDDALDELLRQRPLAWRLRLARAHQNIRRNARAAALVDLQAIPIAVFDNRRLGLVLADRASLGDLLGARAALAGIDLNTATVATFVQGRMARTALEYGACVAAFDAFLQAAGEDHAQSIAAHLLRADCVARGGDARAALAGLLQALKRHPPAEQPDQVLLAVAAFALELATKLEDAAAGDMAKAAFKNLLRGEGNASVAAQLLARRHGWVVREVAMEQSASDELPALALGCYDALARGDENAARVGFEQLRAQRVDHPFVREELALLARRLGFEEPIAPVDPPYPLAIRLASYYAWSQ